MTSGLSTRHNANVEPTYSTSLYPNSRPATTPRLPGGEDTNALTAKPIRLGVELHRTEHVQPQIQATAPSASPHSLPHMGSCRGRIGGYEPAEDQGRHHELRCITCSMAGTAHASNCGESSCWRTPMSGTMVYEAFSPTTDRRVLIQQAHCTGHVGADCTCISRRSQELYYWPSMLEAATAAAHMCTTCLRRANATGSCTRLQGNAGADRPPFQVLVLSPDHQRSI
jgi:hypothetical protein